MKNPPISERAFQASVVRYARLMGWRIAHFRPGRMQSGNWVTPMQGDVGFPDLVLVRGGRLVFAELKRASKKPTAAQREWLEDLNACDGVEVYVWTPDHWDAIEVVLGKTRTQKVGAS